jgi:hypothetical protein
MKNLKQILLLNVFALLVSCDISTKTAVDLNELAQAAINQQKVADGEFYLVIAWSETGGSDGLQRIQQTIMGLTSSNNPLKPNRMSFTPNTYSGSGASASGSGSCICVWATQPEGVDKVHTELDRIVAAKKSLEILHKSGVKSASPSPY